MSLPLPHEGLDELQNFANNLTKEQCWALKAILNARTYDFDIVGNLPVELVAQISSYLTLEDAPFCAYLVSKRWTEVFAASAVRDAFLAKWYIPSDPPFAGIEGLGDDELFKVKLDHALRFLSGKPYHTFEKVLRNDTAEVYDGKNSQIKPYHYCSNAIACIFTSSPPGVNAGARNDTLKIWDLASKRKKVIKTPGREIILTITVTDELVGYITISGVLSALDRKTQRITSLNLPSAVVEAFCGRNSSLCVLIGLTVIIWNVKSQSVQHITLPNLISSTTSNDNLSWNDRTDVQLLLAPDANSIVLFVLVAATPGNNAQYDILYRCRFSLNGELLSMGSLETRSFVADANIDGHYHALGAAPCGQSDTRAVALVSMEEYPNSSVSDTLIMYNELNDEFKQRRIREPAEYYVQEGQGFSFWKGVCFYGEHIDEEQKLKLRHSGGKSWLPLPYHKADLCRGNSDADWSTMHVFGDENVLVTVSFLPRYGQSMKIAGLIFNKDLWDMEETTA